MAIEEFVEIHSDHPRIQRAITEKEELIRPHFPRATFSVAPGYDPAGGYPTAYVNADDLDTAVDCFIDRLATLPGDEGLPLYVIPATPLPCSGTSPETTESLGDAVSAAS